MEVIKSNLKVNNLFLYEDLWNIIIFFISNNSLSSLRNLKSIRITSKLFYKIINKFIYFFVDYESFLKLKPSEQIQINSLQIYDNIISSNISSDIFNIIKSLPNLEYLYYYNLTENEIKELPNSITSLLLRNTLNFSYLPNLLTLIIYNKFNSKYIKLLPTKLKYLRFNIEEDCNQQIIDQLPLSLNYLEFSLR